MSLDVQMSAVSWMDERSDALPWPHPSPPPVVLTLQKASAQAFLNALRGNVDALVMSETAARTGKAARLADMLAVALQKVAVPASEVGAQASIPMEAARQIFNGALAQSGAATLAGPRGRKLLRATAA